MRRARFAGAAGLAGLILVPVTLVPTTGGAQVGPSRYVEVVGAGAVNVPYDSFAVFTDAVGNGATRVAALEAANAEMGRLQQLVGQIPGLDGLSTKMGSPQVTPVCDTSEARPPNRCQIVGYRASIGLTIFAAPAARAADVFVILEDNRFVARGLDFAVRAMEAPGQQAQRLALADADRTARSLAETTGCQLGEPLSIELTRGPPRSPSEIQVTGTGVSGAPVVAPSFGLALEPGTMQVGVTVTVRYALVC